MQVWLCKEIKSGTTAALEMLDKEEMSWRGQMESSDL